MIEKLVAIFLCDFMLQALDLFADELDDITCVDYESRSGALSASFDAPGTLLDDPYPCP